MLVGREYMNKKLIASLLTLGLVLSPVSGAVSESYATGVSSEISQLSKEELLDSIKYNVDGFENFKKTQLYDFAGEIAQNNLRNAINEAKQVLDKLNPSENELRERLEAIENALKELDEASKEYGENINNSIKTNIIKVVKLLKQHVDKAEEEKYKEGLALVDKAKDQLKTENFKTAKSEDLDKLKKELSDFFKDYKAQVSDINEYDVNDEDIKNLDEEIKKSENIPDQKKLENLKADFEALAKSHKDFLKSDKYILASDSLRKAYNDAYEKFENYYGKNIDEESYEAISKAVKDLADAKYKIDSQDHEYKVIKTGPSDEERTVETLKKLTAYVRESRATLEGLKDPDLEKAYKAAIAKAGAYTRNYAKGIPRELKDYQELEVQLKDLTERINKAKNVKVEEDKKIDKLKAVIEKVREFRRTATYESKSKENKDLKDKLEKALIEAEELEDKYKKDPTSVKDEAIDKAIKALEAALDDFYGFNNKDAARKALEALLAKTAGIKIDQIYDTSDQKDAKDAYIKAKDQAAKLVKNKDASVEDLAKAYKDLDDVLNKLAEFLNKRLKDLVDDHPKFSESDKYKKVDADVTKDDVILNYLTVLADAKKELDKAAPDANALNNLYKKLKNARAEINGDMSSQARKLADAIIDGRALMETEEYKKLKAGLTGERKKAAELYSRYLAVAEELQKAGKLDSQDAKDILDLIDHARDFIEGKITEEKYLGNYYYHTLKALKTYKNGDEYKNLPQALRDKLDKALELYEKNSDEKAVFSALDAVWREDAIQAIIKKMESDRNPNVTRDKLLEDLNNLIAEDKDVRESGFKYKKAQKALRDAYDQALKEAKDFIKNNDKPTEEQVRAVYKKLLNAKNALDGDKFSQLVLDLAARFKKEQMKIANPADRQAIADKINSLAGENMTMDDALRVEKELNDLINPKFAATQTLVPQGGVPTTTRPVSTVTNPGSIVKTGINGIAKVAVILVAALGIFKLTSNKGDKK